MVKVFRMCEKVLEVVKIGGGCVWYVDIWILSGFRYRSSDVERVEVTMAMNYISEESRLAPDDLFGTVCASIRRGWITDVENELQYCPSLAVCNSGVMAANSLYRTRHDSVDKSFVDTFTGTVLHKAILGDATRLYP